MKDDFNERLEKYMNGTLDENDRQEVEKELDKLEKYQEFIDQQIPKEKKALNPSSPINKKCAKMIARGKWKARFQNALTVLSIFVVILIVSSILTNVYYTMGKPEKIETYRDVVQFSISVTHPNLRLSGSGMQVNPLFTVDIDGDLEKRIGGEDKKVGEVEGRFFLTKFSFDPLKLYYNSYNEFFPLYPIRLQPPPKEWDTLEKLHEGTVAEAFLAFDQSYPTEKALKKFKDKNLDLLWLAVDTGWEEDGDDLYFLNSPIGFPYRPMWHQNDYTVDSREVEKGFLGTKTIAESGSAPTVEEYGSGDVRDANFIKTLKLLNKYSEISSNIGTFILEKPNERIKDLEENGVKIYGMTVTGPTKEILKLKEEDWIAGMKVGEVALWNME